MDYLFGIPSYCQIEKVNIASAHQETLAYDDNVIV